MSRVLRARDPRDARAPLPIDLLDVTAEPPAEDSWPALVASTIARLSPETNPLLQPRAVLIERGLAKPYAT